MELIIQKSHLKDGYYYSGYMNQNYCAIGQSESKIVCMWDQGRKCFWYWEIDDNKKIKCKVIHLSDIDNEIEIGFLPIKEIIPRQEHVIE